MKELVKAVIPPSILWGARSLRRRAQKLSQSLVKQIRARKAPLLHERLLAHHSGVRPIRVMFLISNTASWKVGPVFTKMLRDPDFEPIAAICPTTSGRLATAGQHTAETARRYLETQGFPYADMIGLDADQTRAEIHRIDPHVVFFTNPHSLVPKYLHDDLLTSRLTCYVPYSHEVMAYGDNQEQYNKASHNSFWRIFVPHEESRRYYAMTRIRGDAGVIVSGFPACEPLLEPVPARHASPWKPQDRLKKRVIYAPHWLWRPDIKMATIDTFGETMQHLAEKYQKDVQWALRPHPMLRPRLIKEPEWGQKRTEDFFGFWENLVFCQLHEDDYIPLFKTSDAIIHDSGSFLAEYLYLRKPAMYLMTEKTGDRYFNNFGRRAITSCDVGRSPDDIERFLDRVLSDDTGDMAVGRFFNEDIAPHFQILPSTKICDEIKRAFS